MSLKFYLAPWTTALSTAAVLDELEHGQSNKIAERITLSTKNGDTRTPEFLSDINPHGQVPVLVHNGVSIWESAAITIYLGENFGVASGLYPTQGEQRGVAMGWIVWTNVAIGEASRRLLRSNRKLESEGLSDYEKQWLTETAIEGAADLKKLLDTLEGCLKGKDYLLGKEYTLADTHVWSFVAPLPAIGVSYKDHPEVKRWVESISSRPAQADSILVGMSRS